MYLIYSFPDPNSFPEIYGKWVENVNSHTPYQFVPKKGSRLCSVHFSPDMIQEGRERVTLKKNAVPTIFPTDEVCDFNFSKLFHCYLQYYLRTKW